MPKPAAFSVVAAALACGGALVSTGALAKNGPDWTAEPDRYVKVDEETYGRNPRRMDVAALGRYTFNERSRAGERCRGYFSVGPQVDVYYQSDDNASRTLGFDVHVSGVNPVLLISGPDGGYDCASGSNPELSYPRARTGLYSIWIGARQKLDNPRPAVLTMSRFVGIDAPDTDDNASQTSSPPPSTTPPRETPGEIDVCCEYRGFAGRAERRTMTLAACYEYPDGAPVDDPICRIPPEEEDAVCCRITGFSGDWFDEILSPEECRGQVEARIVSWDACTAED